METGGRGALGRTAADLRRVTFDSFGPWSPLTVTLEPFDGSPLEWLASRTETWIAQCAKQARALTDADRSYLQSLLPADLDGVVPTYIHHDLKLANCVFAGGNVSGLFDLGEGTTGDPLEDLARSRWSLAHQDPRLVVAFLVGVMLRVLEAVRSPAYATTYGARFRGGRRRFDWAVAVSPTIVGAVGTCPGRN